MNIGADIRFTIFSKTKHGGSLDSADSITAAIATGYVTRIWLLEVD